MKSYRIGRTPYYRDGVLYDEGAVVTIPAKEEPGPGWEPLSKKEAAQAQEQAQAQAQAEEFDTAKVEVKGDKPNAQRPSDRRL